MPSLETPKISKWPFLLADLVLVALGGFVIATASWPLSRWEILGVVPCFLVGCSLAVIPFLRQHAAAVKLWEQTNLAEASRQLSDIHAVAEQIRQATARWQDIQDSATKAAQVSGATVEKVTAEAKAFTEFLSRANDQEKATLRLELDKMRRGANEHIQVMVHMLDHIYALYQAAHRSGVPVVVNQLTQFRNACADAAKRVGLSAHEAQPGDIFDPQTHQSPDNQVPPAGTRIETTIACGFTYQGQPLRRILVALRKENTGIEAGGGATAVGSSTESNPTESSPPTEYQG